MEVREVLEKLNGPYTRVAVGRELNISDKKFADALQAANVIYDKSAKKWFFTGDTSLLETNIRGYVHYVPGKQTTTPEKNANVQPCTQPPMPFTEEEVTTLKTMIEQHTRDVTTLGKYQIYADLEKVPTGVDQERIANYVSKETAARLKKYAKERRLPIQEIVELAIIDLLEKYDRS